MKTIFNWTFGSFFRTIGRIACYFIIGGILFFLLSDKFNDVPIKDFNLIDFFGLQKVNASTWGLGYADNVQYKLLGGGDYQSATYGNGYWTFNGALTESDKNRSYYFKFNQVSIPSNAKTLYANIRLTDLVFSGTSNSSVSNITFDNNSLSCTINHEYDSGENDIYNIDSSPDAFYDWTQIQYNGFNCTLPSLTSETYNVKYGVQLYYTSNGSDNDYYPCYANSSAGDIYSFICPIMSNNISGYRINLVGDTSFQIKIGMANLFNYDTDSTQAIIENQNQNHQETMNTITDTNSTSESSSASDFFHDYNETAQDGIIAIVNMPLNIFNALTLGSTQDLCFTLKGKQVCLPSGNIIWGKTSRTSIRAGNATYSPHPFSSGGDISPGITAFKAIFNLVVGGYLCYKMLKSLMRITNDMLSPTKDKLEVLEL